MLFFSLGDGTKKMLKPDLLFSSNYENKMGNRNLNHGGTLNENNKKKKEREGVSVIRWGKERNKWY